MGVDDQSGAIIGLSPEQIRNHHCLLANTANCAVKPPAFITAEVVGAPSGDDVAEKVLEVEVAEGITKPCKDKTGAIWIKQGFDKRRLSDKEKQIRLFQHRGALFLDKTMIPRTSIDDVYLAKVDHYIQAIRKQGTIEPTEITGTMLTHLSIPKDGQLALGGLLFFAKQLRRIRPAFFVKAISFFGNSVGENYYRGSMDITGTIPEMFERAIRFLTACIHHDRAGQATDSIGKLEVSQTALEELLQNALVHRDYSQNAPVSIMVFDNRIEIVSHGALPNSLSVEKVEKGIAVARNTLLRSYCSKWMSYAGFGSGIARAVLAQPNIELINYVEGEQFKVMVPRP